MTSATIRPGVQIGSIVRNALVFNFKTLRRASVNMDHLVQTVELLFDLLQERKIDYLLVGGIALLHYIEGRNTEDIDLIMSLSSLKKLPEITLTSQDKNFARGTLNELQIDLLLTHNALFDRVKTYYATTQVLGTHTIPCATVEGLLLLKLYALPSLYRQGNFARVGLYENDIATLLHDYHPDLEPILTELTDHLNGTDLAAIQEVLTDLQQRLARFGKGFSQ